MSLDMLLEMNGKPCSCGKSHRFQSNICSGNGAINKIPAFIAQYHAKKVFVFFDQNTYAAAGKQVCRILDEKSIRYTSYIFAFKNIEPDEQSVGSAIMHYDHSCDMIIAVGSGVVNDIGKILSITTGNPYMIVATAPSMDGYASASSSMTRDGLKISLPTRSADVIIGDTDILCQAPLHMMRSGLGDMIAKYVSICEWRIAHIVTGEYYCEQIAQLIRNALKRCVDNADGLLAADPDAGQAVFEGLVIGGVAMNYAGLSRPASGVEHYISHILDMRSVEFGTPAEFHGIQCAAGTYIAALLYEKIKNITPNKEKALKYVESFDYSHWVTQLRSLLGKGAEAMITLEQKEKKYDTSAHKARLDIILQHWDTIVGIINEELPDINTLSTLFDKVGLPKTLEELGANSRDLPLIFRATKDIRDKYVLSRLAWDLGILDELL